LHDGFIFLFFFRSDTEAWFYSWNSSSGQHEDTSWSCWCPYANGEVSLSSLLSVSCIEQVELYYHGTSWKSALKIGRDMVFGFV
jgi:hypothetical protein